MEYYFTFASSKELKMENKPETPYKQADFNKTEEGYESVQETHSTP
jgi:hypothetical protein